MAFLNITNSTTVGNFNDTIKALEEAKKKALSSAERERLQQFITKYTTTKEKLISICKKDIKEHQMYIDPKVKAEADKLTRDGFHALSIESWTKVVQLHNDSNIAGPDRKANAPTMKDIAFDNHGEGWLNFLEGKSGLTLMTSVKASLTTMALAGLHTIGAFNLIPTLITTLFTLNPVLGAAAAVLAVTGTAMLVKKIFGPELTVWKNKIKTNILGNKSIDTYMSKSDHIDLDAEAREQEKIRNKEAGEREEGEQRDNGTFDKEFEDKIKSLVGKNNPSLAADVDKLKKEYANKVKDARIIDKVVEEVFGNDLVARATDLATSTKRDNSAEVEKLRNLYAGVLTPERIDQILTEANLVIENPNLRTTADEVIAGGEDNKKGYDASTASTAYREFKAAYDAIIVKLTSNTYNLAEINNDIHALEDYAKPATFLKDATASGYGVPSSWKLTDPKKAAKIAKLCGGMIGILRELSTQLGQGKGPVDAKKTQKDHGLTEQQLQEIDDLMKN